MMEYRNDGYIWSVNFLGAGSMNISISIVLISIFVVISQTLLFFSSVIVLVQ